MQVFLFGESVKATLPLACYEAAHDEPEACKQVLRFVAAAHEAMHMRLCTHYEHMFGPVAFLCYEPVPYILECNHDSCLSEAQSSPGVQCSVH
eukprot:1133671-Pelagomonas_calceolata.AAC.6